MKNQTKSRVLGRSIAVVAISFSIVAAACGPGYGKDVTVRTLETPAMTTPGTMPQAQSSSGTPSPSASTPARAPGADAPKTCPAGFVAEQTEGPYYKAGSPERTGLREQGTVGEPLALSGYVFDKNCNPVAGAWLDFWQADGNGDYDNDGFRLRGYQFTDAQGKYVLQTVVPGEYPGRTIHIHVKLRQGAGGDVTTTQLYFPNQAGNSSDSIFSAPMLVSLSEGDGQKIAFFNFKLDE